MWESASNWGKSKSQEASGDCWDVWMEQDPVGVDRNWEVVKDCLLDDWRRRRSFTSDDYV